ncbi:hypothetical protein [Streptomyces sp. CB03578]|uniref:hypothetical protein n=1 Tax=Streptomyces sp. CB03578 TaxID=1718987 RepID=UPI0011611181|nr:hypothetical protein [Streptomyces sp. CB03578]
MTTATMRRSTLAAGPICMTVYGLIRLTDEKHGPGLAWSSGHLALLAGVLCFVPVFRGLSRMAAEGRGRGARRLADAGVTAGLIGVVAISVQAGIDLVVGFLSEDRAAMQVLFERVQSRPMMEPVFYSVGPMLFYVGLLLLMVQLAVLRRAGAWWTVVIVAGIAVSMVSLDLLPLGGLLFLAALVTLGSPAPGVSSRAS